MFSLLVLYCENAKGFKKIDRNASTFHRTRSRYLSFVASTKLDISLHQRGSKCQNNPKSSHAPPFPSHGNSQQPAERGLTNQVIKRRCWRRCCPLPRLAKRRSPLTFPRACRGILRSRRSGDGAGQPTLSSVQLERKGTGSGGRARSLPPPIGSRSHAHFGPPDGRLTMA